MQQPAALGLSGKQNLHFLCNQSLHFYSYSYLSHQNKLNILWVDVVQIMINVENLCSQKTGTKFSKCIRSVMKNYNFFKHFFQDGFVHFRKKVAFIWLLLVMKITSPVNPISNKWITTELLRTRYHLPNLLYQKSS